jgi:hypothetical protein
MTTVTVLQILPKATKGSSSNFPEVRLVNIEVLVVQISRYLMFGQREVQTKSYLYKTPLKQCYL